MRRTVLAILLATPAFCFAVESGYWRDFQPQHPAQRIVSLAPSATEMLFALGLGSRVVGVTRYCDRPPEAQKLPKVGGFSDPSLEAVLALKPDLVVAVPAEANKKVADRLVDLAVPVLVVPGTTMADVFVALTTLGRALNVPDDAVKLSARIKGELDGIARAVAGRPAPRVLVVYDHRPLIVGGPGAFADEVLGLAGAQNVVARGTVPYPTLSLEVVAQLAPDVILDASMGAQEEKARAQAVHAFDRFPSIPAVKSGRIHVLPSGTLMRPGVAIADDVRLVARLLHPGVKL